MNIKKLSLCLALLMCGEAIIDPVDAVQKSTKKPKKVVTKKAKKPKKDVTKKAKSPKKVVTKKGAKKQPTTIQEAVKDPLTNKVDAKLAPESASDPKGVARPITQQAAAGQKQDNPVAIKEAIVAERSAPSPQMGPDGKTGGVSPNAPSTTGKQTPQEFAAAQAAAKNQSQQIVGQVDQKTLQPAVVNPPLKTDNQMLEEAIKNLKPTPKNVPAETENDINLKTINAVKLKPVDPKDQKISTLETRLPVTENQATEQTATDQVKGAVKVAEAQVAAPAPAEQVAAPDQARVEAAPAPAEQVAAPAPAEQTQVAAAPAETQVATAPDQARVEAATTAPAEQVAAPTAQPDSLEEHRAIEDAAHAAEKEALAPEKALEKAAADKAAADKAAADKLQADVALM